jgi:small subunit ribosomal protein S20
LTVRSVDVATHKQALKRHRQSLNRRDRNSYYESTARTFLKRAREALAAGNAEEAQGAVRSATVYLDRVASKGAIPKGRADRLKSRLMSQLAAL